LATLNLTELISGDAQILHNDARSFQAFPLAEVSYVPFHGFREFSTFFYDVAQILKAKNIPFSDSGHKFTKNCQFLFRAQQLSL
jgi:hypothetical protein